MINNTAAHGTFRVRSHVTPNPAPGANALIIMPGYCRTQIIGMSFNLTTDVNVAGRKIQNWATITGTLFLWGADDTALPASQNVDFHYWPFIADTENLSTESIMLIPFNHLLMFDSLDTLSITVVNKQVGDQLSNIVTLYREWIS